MRPGPCNFLRLPEEPGAARSPATFDADCLRGVQPAARARQLRGVAHMGPQPREHDGGVLAHERLHGRGDAELPGQELRLHAAGTGGQGLAAHARRASTGSASARATTRSSASARTLSAAARRLGHGEVVARRRRRRHPLLEAARARLRSTAESRLRTNSSSAYAREDEPLTRARPSSDSRASERALPECFDSHSRKERR